MLDGALLVGKQLQSACHGLLESIEKWWSFKDAAEKRKRRSELELVNRQIRDRLYGRYRLIDQVHDIAELKHADNERFSDLKRNLNLRIEYLTSFNEKIPTLLVEVDPKIASSMTTMTEKSILLYRSIVSMGVEDFLAVAPSIEQTLREVAQFLENAVKKIEETHLRE